jgi:hypothetical protein
MTGKKGEFAGKKGELESATVCYTKKKIGGRANKKKQEEKRDAQPPPGAPWTTPDQTKTRMGGKPSLRQPAPGLLMGRRRRGLAGWRGLIVHRWTAAPKGRIGWKRFNARRGRGNPKHVRQEERGQ